MSSLFDHEWFPKQKDDMYNHELKFKLAKFIDYETLILDIGKRCAIKQERKGVQHQIDGDGERQVWQVAASDLIFK